MGMYDNVEYTTACPKCQTPMTNFQSKDGPCDLLTLKPVDVDRFYDICRRCGLWVEFETEVYQIRTLIRIQLVKPKLTEEEKETEERER